MYNTATENILAKFDAINAVPRRSCNLGKIHRWLMAWGREKGFNVHSDNALNILISVPATAGYEKAPTLVLQGHMDMVCEKRPDVEHDFQNDPIVSWRDGDWLRAKGTSLGADNGIALAMFFELVTDPKAQHPKLEILITSDEETGLVGAQKLQPGFLTGKVLLNVDSEEEGVFTIGCAGGMDTNLTFPVHREKLSAEYTLREILVGGLEGGHSGLDIHLNKANANVLLLRAIRTLLDAIPDIRLSHLNGGTAHNAIPREANAQVAVPSRRLAEVEELILNLETVLKKEYADHEKNLFLMVAGEALTEKAGFFSEDDNRKIVDALRLIPHGVKSMSTEIEGMVDTSMNFAMLRTEESFVKVLTNQRSATMSRGTDFSEILFGLARLYGGIYENGNYYPSWEPSPDSNVLRRAKKIWENLFNQVPGVEVTHAGLECGAIGARFSGMDMISFGPTIKQPHSPDERLFIPSVGRVYVFFREFVRSFKSEKLLEEG